MEIKSIPINSQGLLHSRATVYATQGWRGGRVGGGGGWGGDFYLVHHFPVSLHLRDVAHYSSSLNKHLVQVPGNRLPHNAWLFAAGVALMPAVMNQPRLPQQLKGNQIYTRSSIAFRNVWLKSADKGVGHAVCLSFSSSKTFSAGQLAPFVVNDWTQICQWLETSE